MGRLEKEVERGDEGGGYGNTMCDYVPTTPDRNASLSMQQTRNGPRIKEGESIYSGFTGPK